jgi:glycyl-tRNA synthetase beta chain
MNASNLLVELFVEELPPKALQKLGEAFGAVLFEQLKAQGLLASSESRLTAYASPRRLAAHITEVLPQAEDKAVSQKLMPVAVGLDAAGQPTPALLKKLAALGADASAVAGLQRQGEGKAEALFYASTVKGVVLTDGLQKALDDTIAKLPIPKVMRYQLQDGWTSVNFVRPAHGLVALHGTQVLIGVKALGLSAGTATHGHRFEAKVDPVVIRDADSYAEQLREEGAVIASFAERRAEIVRQLQAAADRVGGGVRPIDDEALLDEVTALVERPNVLVCEFEKEFLAVPQECLILTMKANQKYFPLLDTQGKLTHQFLIVSNITPQDASAVIGGNERVVRPRLADAKFFFDQDRKKTLASRVEALGKVVYHNKLGTQGERVDRVRAIAKDGDGARVFYSPRTPHNVDTMVKALAAARRRYGAWFGDYPWTNLRVTQFPGLAGYAQGFPGNISFAEGIGYLAKPLAVAEDAADAEAAAVDVAFYIVAHESGHQWWGNIVTPGKGPGGNIISEGLAEFSALLLMLELLLWLLVMLLWLLVMLLCLLVMLL